MTAIHTLTNGTQNFVFEADEEETIIKTVNVFGGVDKVETFSTAEARQHWAFALQCGCNRGWTVCEYREQPSAYDDNRSEMRMRWEREQSSAYDDNRWEAELALAQG